MEAYQQTKQSPQNKEVEKFGRIYADCNRNVKELFLGLFGVYTPVKKKLEEIDEGNLYMYFLIDNRLYSRTLTNDLSWALKKYNISKRKVKGTFRKVKKMKQLSLFEEEL